MLLTPALLCHKDSAKGTQSAKPPFWDISCLSLCLYDIYYFNTPLAFSSRLLILVSNGFDIEMLVELSDSFCPDQQISVFNKQIKFD